MKNECFFFINFYVLGCCRFFVCLFFPQWHSVLSEVDKINNFCLLMIKLCLLLSIWKNNLRKKYCVQKSWRSFVGIDNFVSHSAYIRARWFLFSLLQGMKKKEIWVFNIIVY